MKKITTEELKTVLENHLHWLREDCKGWEKMRADLRYADLRYADLRYADLSNANLRYADLRYADLRYADLRYAELSYAELSNANLRYADLRYAELSNANLRYADLSNANLRYANLSYAKNFYYPMNCPSSGSFTGYKKALYRREDGTVGTCLITLFIPADARRSSATSFKCRCDKAYVTNMWSIDEDTYGKNVTVAYSNYDRSFEYERGSLITVEDFCEDRWRECARGIHFFVDEKEAERYEL